MRVGGGRAEREGGDPRRERRNLPLPRDGAAPSWPALRRLSAEAFGFEPVRNTGQLLADIGLVVMAVGMGLMTAKHVTPSVTSP